MGLLIEEIGFWWHVLIACFREWEVYILVKNK